MFFQSLDIYLLTNAYGDEMETQNLGSSASHIMSIWVLASGIVLDTTFYQIYICFSKSQKESNLFNY